MRHFSLRSAPIVPLLLLFTVCVGCGSSQSYSGVARVDQSPAVNNSFHSSEQTNSTAGVTLQSSKVNESEDVSSQESTDEEITTIFTQCMRDHGFSTDDPVLNADGTVDLAALKQDIDQGPKSGSKDLYSRRALENCVPLLEGATFVRKESIEDNIKLQDDLLNLTQCLRDNGLNVPDPDFTSGTRESMKAVYLGLKKTLRVQKAFDNCTEATFGTKK